MEHKSAANAYYDMLAEADLEAIKGGKKNPVRSKKAVERIKEKVSTSFTAGNWCVN